MSEMISRRLETPIGELLLFGHGETLTAIQLPQSRQKAAPIPCSDAGLDEAVRQLQEYFAGERRAFDLELDPEGTEFQRQVWQALAEIPFGETISYGELAARVGRPKAARAVGAANGQNPLPLVLPCHRVIGADGSLTGFGGGLDAKQFLLEHEGALASPQLRLPVAASA